MKTKKLLAVLSSVTLAASGVSSLVTSAAETNNDDKPFYQKLFDGTPIDEDYEPTSTDIIEYYQHLFAGLIEIDDSGLYDNLSDVFYEYQAESKDYTTYYSPDTNRIYRFVKAVTTFQIEFDSEGALNEGLALIEEYNKENGTNIELESYVGLSRPLDPNDPYAPFLFDPADPIAAYQNYKEVYRLGMVRPGDETAKILTNLFSGNPDVDAISYKRDLWRFDSRYSYNPNNYLSFGEGYDEIKEYVESTGLNCEIVDYGDKYPYVSFGLEFPEELSLEEQIKVKKDMYDALGDVIPFSEQYWGMDSNWVGTYEEHCLVNFDGTINNGALDLTDAVDGDANCDMNLNLSDAVLVMQAVSNPDSYKLNSAQAFNADIYNTGDGVTAADAQYIQSYLLGSAE